MTPGIARRKTPIRTCVSCRMSSEKKNLVRIVQTADGDVRVDPSGKLPGRGAYLCGAKECTVRAIKTNKLGRALRCEVPERLRAELESLAEKNAMTAENRDMRAE